MTRWGKKNKLSGKDDGKGEYSERRGQTNIEWLLPTHVNIVSSCRSFQSCFTGCFPGHLNAYMKRSDSDINLERWATQTTMHFNLTWITDLHVLYNANPYSCSIMRQNSIFRHQQHFDYFFGEHYIFLFMQLAKSNLIQLNLLTCRNGAMCCRPPVLANLLWFVNLCLVCDFFSDSCLHQHAPTVTIRCYMCDLLHSISGLSDHINMVKSGFWEM